ncbi:uncharacterized protein mslna [Paramisgurnus dabryanus]|uniref:uncharacterized protein mslna n=1 Tax=Paramisgurnus dabryanus TaxID=90735 RepID=UPI0031F43705
MGCQSVKMRHFQLCLVLFGFGFITVTNSQYTDATLNNTLSCSGIPLTDVPNLKGFTDATFDLYTALRSKVSVSPNVSSVINSIRNGSQLSVSLNDSTYATTYFNLKLNAYLPSSLPKETLFCLSQSSLSCDTFQFFVRKFDALTSPESEKMVYQNFIKSFLTRKDIDVRCSNTSDQEWLLQNFQGFSTYATYEDFLTLKPDFNGMNVSAQLTPEQRAGLAFNLLASGTLNNDSAYSIFNSFQTDLQGVTVNLTIVNSNETTKTLNDFLVLLKPLGRFIQSSVNKIIKTPSLSGNVTQLLNFTLSYLPLNGSVNSTLSAMNSSNIIDWTQNIIVPMVQKYLASGQTLTNSTSDISSIVFATDPPLTDPADICTVPSSNSTCRTTERFAKALNCVASLNLTVSEDNLRLLIAGLNKQVLTAANQSTGNSSNLSALYGELPTDSFTPENLDDVDFMNFWFQIKMTPLLPTVPGEYLSCLSTREFSCQVYRQLVVGLSNNSALMGNLTQAVYTNLIRPFLTRRLNTSGDCTLNNSVDFILQNLGGFSAFAQLQDFYNLSLNFSALDAIPALSVDQLSQLVFTPPAGVGDRNEVLRRVFDFLLQASNRDKLIKFLPSLQKQARLANFSCENYRNIFDRIDQALSSLLPNQTDALLTIRDLIMMIPPDECILRASQCAVTPVNETAICASVNSSALSQFLNTETVNATGSLNVCNFSVQQFACLPMVSKLNPQQVADLLACSPSSNVTKDTWKLFFSKLGTQLDDALQRFTNMTQSPSNVSLSSVMDVIVEVRIDRLSPQRLRDPVFVGTWMQGKLRPFLPSISSGALSCLSNKNFSCESYRAIFMVLNNNTGPMGNPTQNLTYTNFIRPFLTQTLNSDGGCMLPFSNSLDFILQNFAIFSPFAQLQDFYNLSSNFSALDALSVLTPMQLNDLVFRPPARVGDRNEVLRRVFDFLLQPSNRDRLIHFLPVLQSQARLTNFSCENYRNIFDRIDQALSSLLPNQTDALLTIRDSIMMIPPDECILRASECAVTPVNEMAICASVNSSALSQFLNTVTVNATGSLNVCNFSVQQFACLSTVSRLNPQQVADLLACSPSSNVTKDTWKLFFSKLGTQLDDALQRFTNMTQSPNNVSLSSVMDVIVEVRIDRLSPQRLRDPAFVGTWMQGKLRPFLPSISSGALSCLSTKNFSCESYRAIFMVLNNNTGPMGNPTQNLTYTNFIRPFLTQRLNSGDNCTLPFSNSLDFILQNFGVFSPLAQLQDFYNLSGSFSALDALSVLTPVQLNDLVFRPPARVGDRNEVLRRVFDFLLQPSNRDKLHNFLPVLQSQARPSNFICENYRNIFDRIDQALSSLLPNQTDALLTIRDSIMMIPPDECILRASQCAVTPVNETAICASVNSSALDQFLNTVTVNATGSLNVCNFSVQQFACLPMFSKFNPQQVADLLACTLSNNVTVTKDTWKLFFSKLGTQLDDALQRFTNRTQSPSNVSLSDVLDVIVDVRIDRLSPQRLRDPAFIGTWFQGRLNPFLPSVSQGSLSCLSTKNLTCETYQRIVGAFVNVVPQDGQDICKPLQSTTITQRQDLIYTQFINAFLSRNDTDDPRCLRDTANSSQWLARNFGPFAQSARLMALQTLNKNFTAVEVLPSLTVRQLSEFAATPGSLTEPSGVNNTMQYVKDCQLGVFFDLFSPAVQGVPLTQDVKAALIQQIFNRAKLSNVNTSNDEVLNWINIRLNPLLTNLTDSLVTPLFGILGTRDCNITQAAVNLLDVVRPSMPNNTKSAVYNNILQSFRGPAPLRCYRNNSFIAFLNESLLGFGPLPNVTTLLSLIPPPRITEIVNSLAPPELGNYLAQPNVVDGDREICVIFKNLAKTPVFMETVDVPDNVKSKILPCVWPLALSSDNQTEINLWFDRRLSLYLQFLNTDILGSIDTMNASCLSYKKMVNVLGSPSFNSSQLNSMDIYNSAIKTYLTTASQPKCFNVNDTRLNSTAWFVDYIGVNYINFVSIDDLYSFGSETTIKLFSVNPDNIKLFNQSGIPKNVLNRYTELIFLQNSNFDLLSLPSTLQCDAPVSAFNNINENQTNVILANFKTSCSDVDPQISAVLVGKLPKTINADVINNLGQESVGLTTVQISNAPPSVIISGLSTLSNATGWSFGQAQAIITVILNGNFQLNSGSSLLSLGSLIGGIPSEKLTAIAPQQLLETSRNPTFIQNILIAPEIVQRTFVTQIISINTSVSALMANVPSEMALQIPRNHLIIPDTADPQVLKQFNDKKWKPEQAVLFFDSVAEALNDSEKLSVDVLQGFTCARVQRFSKVKVSGFVRACRHREDRPKVVLSESQLTCMYNLIRDDSPLDFVNYPTDMLLYYNYNAIPRSNCTSYFTQVGSADFSVLSAELQGKRDTLWSNAQGCLNIVGTSLKKTDLAVLGNLVCAASKDYILNSDPEIIENLKNCKDLSDLQIAAMETVLLNGTSKYGPPSTWNQKTLADLGNLPLHFSQKFWASFKLSDLVKFLKTFLKSLRDINTPKPRMKRLFNALIVTTTPVVARAGETCTKGNITNIEISDNAFPFGYTATQFKLCMSAQVASDNLAALCEKIDISDFQRIILDKLNEISPNGLSESQVKVLGAVSRNATLDEINKWNITKADTLAALMNANNGEWTSGQSNLIITKYLKANNSLTATELNLVKGPNLCSLDTSTLSSISPDSIKGADALDVSKCSSDNKKALFAVANKAFPIPSTRVSSSLLTLFQLIEAYLGGADLSYIQGLANLNISMSLATFMKLDPSVVTNLTVSDVKGLLGMNLRDLKTYENQTTVRSWISSRLQSDLDTLNISLSGGKATATSPTNTVVTNAAAVTAAATTTKKPSSGAPGIRPSKWSLSFTIFVLIFTIINVEITEHR